MGKSGRSTGPPAEVRWGGPPKGGKASGGSPRASLEGSGFQKPWSSPAIGGNRYYLGERGITLKNGERKKGQNK